MQQTAQAPPPPTSPSFAGLLASLAAPAKETAYVWPDLGTDDDLDDNFATLSYERALRTHSRYRPPDLSDRSLTQAADPRPVDSYELAPPESLLFNAAPADPTATQSMGSGSGKYSSPDPRLNAHLGSAGCPSKPSERDLRCASITIRLSQAECVQLRKRAAEAGLSVSAYLRSCTFEAESLRALVKDTMAQLRSATAPKATIAEAPHRSRFGWLRHLLTNWRGARQAAHA